jgi:hypothetical protein
LFISNVPHICYIETIENNVQLHINTRKYWKCTWEENRMYTSNVKIIAISEIYEIFVSAHFVSED